LRIVYFITSRVGEKGRHCLSEEGDEMGGAGLQDAAGGGESVLVGKKKRSKSPT